MEYETPLCPHCPFAGPEIAPGMLGMPLAMPLQRWALAFPQALTAVTHTCEPAGIEAGKDMLQLVPEGVTIAPATVVLQL